MQIVYVSSKTFSCWDFSKKVFGGYLFLEMINLDVETILRELGDVAWGTGGQLVVLKVALHPLPRMSDLKL